MKVTNTSEGPRGLNTKKGQVVLNPGESRDDIELVEAEAKIAKDSGWFAFGAEADKAAKEAERAEQAPAKAPEPKRS